MSIINCRPLTVQNINDPNGPEPLTPNHFLTMKTKVIMPPPGSFVKEDVYARKRWRKTQYLLNEFWTRWRKEYILLQQMRTKWTKESPNLKIGDVVIIRDDDLPNTRGQWTLGKVTETIVDKDDLVRRVKLMIATSKLDKLGKRADALTILERPIHKLTVTLLVESQ